MLNKPAAVTPEDIEKLRALEKAATPGPWDYDTEALSWTSEGYAMSCIETPDGMLWFTQPDTGNEMVRQLAAAKLSAATRNALPALLDAAEENERLQERIVALEAKSAVLGGDFCLEARAAGRNVCGACSICVKEAKEENERLQEALEDMIGMAAALDDDDPYYGAQRDATARIESARTALKIATLEKIREAAKMMHDPGKDDELSEALAAYDKLLEKDKP